MQLIFESEAVLDSNRNMSAVQDIQNEKVECLDIKEQKRQINNVNNDIIECNTAAKEIGFCENKDNLDNVQFNTLDDETEISEAKLTTAISEQSKLEVQNELVGKDGSLTLSTVSEKERCIVEKDNNYKSEEILEEDYLEDDIISIRTDSYAVSDTLCNVEKNKCHNDDKIILKDNQLKESMNMDVDEDIKEIPFNAEDDHSIEPKQTKGIDNLQSNKFIDPPVNEETKSQQQTAIEAQDDKQLAVCLSEKVGEQVVENIHSEKLTETHEQEVIEVMDDIEDVELSTDQNSKEKVTRVPEQLEVVQSSNIKELELSNVHCERTAVVQDQEKMEVVELMDEPEFCTDLNTAKETLTEVHEEINAVKSKETEISNIIKRKETVVEEIPTIDIDEKGKEGKMKSTLPKDQGLIEESKKSVVLCEQNAQISTEDINDSNHSTKGSDPALEQNKVSVDIAQNKKKSQITIPIENQEPEVMLLNKSPAICENNTDSLTKQLKEDSDCIINEEIKLNVHTNKLSPVVGDIDATNNTENEIDSVAAKFSSSVIETNERDVQIITDIVPTQCENNKSPKAGNSISDTCLKIVATTANETTKSSEIQVDISGVSKVYSPKLKQDDNNQLKESENKSNVDNDKTSIDNQMDIEEIIDNTSSIDETIDAVNNISSKNSSEIKSSVGIKSSNTLINNKDKLIACKSSYTLDILSDEEEMSEPPKAATPNVLKEKDKQCINSDDDDDIMLIDEETTKTKEKANNNTDNSNKQVISNTDLETGEKTLQDSNNLLYKNDQNESSTPPIEMKDTKQEASNHQKSNENTNEKPTQVGPLIPDNFLSTAKTKLSDMTRGDLEEFCILKIVEGIIDRSSLSDIKNKLKEMTQGLEDYRKKAMMLTKQNRDLQVVLKSVQEEQKKVTRDTPIMPLKLTRSVGVQVFMEKSVIRKKVPQQNNNKNINTTQNKNSPVRSAGQTKQSNQNIPVPRLVPANNPTLKTPSTVPQMNTPNKVINPPNGALVRNNPSPSMKADKRPHNKIASAETVDLTDDEPPTKMPGGPRHSPAPPVRLVPSQNLMAPQRQPFAQNMNSPRKVYIPISGPANQALRPGQTIMLKSVPAPGLRARCPTPQRVDSSAMRLNRMVSRHPAPLPFATKQYQPPNWKNLPPAPDLKLSKVENGIVISWKIEGVSEDSYEEIASYQLFAYQETSLPANTALWKKIGDVKALPLPMACTLTQFMAGFKYYFAVRAVDIRSRLGPFSLPGSILLLNKNILD